MRIQWLLFFFDDGWGRTPNGPTNSTTLPTSSTNMSGSTRFRFRSSIAIPSVARSSSERSSYLIPSRSNFKGTETALGWNQKFVRDRLAQLQRINRSDKAMIVRVLPLPVAITNSDFRSLSCSNDSPILRIARVWL